MQVNEQASRPRSASFHYLEKTITSELIYLLFLMVRL